MPRFLTTPLLLVTLIYSASATTSTSTTVSTAKVTYHPPLKRSNTKKVTAVNQPLPAIIGGEIAGDNEFPWFGRTDIAIYNNNTLVDSLVCGGSLIHSDIVLTAASCFVDTLRENSNYELSVAFYLGANQYNGSDGILYNVSYAFWPSDYAFPTDDIAFLILTSNATVSPVSWNTDPSIPKIGDIGTAIGFGLTSTPNGTELSPLLRKVDIPAAVCYEGAPSTVTCAFAPNATKSICDGDSGGPILTPSGAVYGVSSSISNVSCTAGPNGFTRTSSFSDFIPRTICDNSASPPQGCVGFGTPPCGLFGLSIFCPLTFGGIFGRLLRAIFGLFF